MYVLVRLADGTVLRAGDIEPGVVDLFERFRSALTASTVQDIKGGRPQPIDSRRTPVVRKALAFKTPIRIQVAYTDREDFRQAQIRAFFASFPREILSGAFCLEIETC